MLPGIMCLIIVILEARGLRMAQATYVSALTVDGKDNTPLAMMIKPENLFENQFTGKHKKKYVKRFRKSRPNSMNVYISSHRSSLLATCWTFG